jgi:hypothetical protein
MKTLSRSVSTPVMVLLASCVLHAAPIFVSGDGIGETFAHPGAYMGTGLPYSGTPVVIASNTLPGAWATSDNGAKWISPGQTGQGGQVLPNTTVNSIFATAYFYESFTAFGTDVLVHVWADDTARVMLNGKQLGPDPNFAIDNACAAGPIGCEQSEGLVYRFKAADLLAGTGANKLTVSAFQTGGGPFGVMYEGSAVPEPGTYALMGLGLLAVGLARKLRASKA